MTIDTSKEAHQSAADSFCFRIHEYRKFRVRTDDGEDHVFENANDAIRFAIENKIFPLGVTMDAIMSAVLEGDAIKRIAAERDAQTARADAAEAEVARLTAENERLCEALTTKRDYVQDVATGVLVNVSPVSLVGMAKDDLERINAALQRKAGE